MVVQDPPLIVHVIHHLIMGGLENGLINLINSMPRDRYRHAVLCIDRYSDFSSRLQDPGVEVVAMHRKPGRDLAATRRMWRYLKDRRPAIVHTRNLSGLDALLPAALAGVRVRIHSEHGWHDQDPDGSKLKFQLLRRLHRPLVSHYVTVSEDLRSYLHQRVGIPTRKISRIVNGVDTDRFRPASPDEQTATRRAKPDSAVTIGFVGRFQKIKDPMNLALAFVELLRRRNDVPGSVRLAMIGDGPELPRVRDYLTQSGVIDLCSLPGSTEDVPARMREFDIFALPSLGEGISNTILEAMATALPVVATRVGGNAELVDHGRTGLLAEPGNPAALADLLGRYVDDASLRETHGVAARSRAELEFSLRRMTADYLSIYDALRDRVVTG